MLTFLSSSIFESPAQTVVNTVNTVGVMGKGIAKGFKERYPAMFADYKKLCANGELTIGKLHLWRGSMKWVLNFPTKTTWRLPSEIDYIEKGLRTFAEQYKTLGITSVSFPPLGCGNGNLDWNDVRPIMERHLNDLDIQVYIHDFQVGTTFVPEHMERNATPAPSSLQDFLLDLRGTISRHKNAFKTIESGDRFKAELNDQQDLIVQTGTRKVRISAEIVELIWSSMQVAPVTVDNFSTESNRKSKSYLFPVLASLPYIRLTEFRKRDENSVRRGHALFLIENAGRRPDSSSERSTSTNQLCLSL